MKYERPHVPLKLRTYVKPDGSLSERPIKEQAFMVLAAEMAAQATCSRLQVGTVFVDAKLERVLCVGYNGNVAGGPNGCDTEEPGQCGCLHSEVGALSKSRDDLNGSVCFVTASPCLMCSKLLINRRVSRVVYLEEYRRNDGVLLLRKHGVVVERYCDLPG